LRVHRRPRTRHRTQSSCIPIIIPFKVIDDAWKKGTKSEWDKDNDKQNPIQETSLEREWRKMLFVWVKISATEFSDKAEPFKIDHDQ
jgi:hypothetical protein